MRRRSIGLFLAASALCLGCQASEDVLGRNLTANTERKNPVLTLQGSRFSLDGAPIDLWGIRVASATMSEALTDQLIAQLDEYRRYGVNTVTVFYQGSSGGEFDPFSPDGSSIDAAHQLRMARIIEACAERDMVVVVGIFYAGADAALADWAASVEAVRTVSGELTAYDNVILNVANQQNADGYSDKPWAKVRTLAGLEELFQAVHSVDPTRLVGSGGYDFESNVAIGLSADTDALLFSGGGLASQMTAFRQRNVTDKPILCVELYGSDTEGYTPAGVFSDEVKANYFADADAGAADEALSVFFHATPWTQSAERGSPRYDLGGEGTIADPGIRWYFEHVAQLRGLKP